MIQLTRSAAFGTDIGVVNTTAGTVDVEVALLDSSGGPISNSISPLLPFGHIQLADPLGADVSGAFALVRCTTDGGRILPYATVVDVTTQDATHVSGQLHHDTAALFGDGFESGGTSAWSDVVP